MIQQDSEVKEKNLSVNNSLCNANRAVAKKKSLQREYMNNYSSITN